MGLRLNQSVMISWFRMRAQRYKFQIAMIQMLLYTWYVSEKTASVVKHGTVEYEKAGGRLSFQSSRSESINFANVTTPVCSLWDLSAVARRVQSRPIIGTSRTPGWPGAESASATISAHSMNSGGTIRFL